ncbi:hypothetical protein ACFYOF_16815 [Streptomyces sp. NPDC007148]|uniref:hypothetical protein n=1 Tax=Streptomyces sp. NPDC007148 TaxID=3364775 RepID=UPI0036CA84F4
MSQPTPSAQSPGPDRVTAIYDAIDAFQRKHRTGGGLGHAQIRALLAEHVDQALANNEPTVSAPVQPTTRADETLPPPEGPRIPNHTVNEEEAPSTPAPHAERRNHFARVIYERWNPGSQWADAHPDDVIAYSADADVAMTAADAVTGTAYAPPGLADVYREIADRLAALGTKSTCQWARPAARKVREWGDELRRMAGEEQPTTETPGIQLARQSVQAMVDTITGQRTTDAVVAQDPVCQGFVWIGQSFATCDRCGQPAWDHEGEEVPADGAGLLDDRRAVRPWKPGQADRIRAKWDPTAVVARQDGAVARSTPADRLARIAEAHIQGTLSGMTSGQCIECEQAWPCPTSVWATTERDPYATWDPADNEPGAPCPAALLPKGDAPTEPCIVEGPHDLHVTALGRRWKDNPDAEPLR